jgi:hypothetical protein
LRREKRETHLNDFDNLLDKSVVNRFMDINALDGAARLTRVEHGAVDNVLSGVGGVAVCARKG